MRPQGVYTIRVSHATHSLNAHSLAAAPAARPPTALGPVAAGPAPRPAESVAHCLARLLARSAPAAVRATPAAVRAPHPRLPGSPVEPRSLTPPPRPASASHAPPPRRGSASAHPAVLSQRAPARAKKRPAASSVIRANAGIHPYLSHPPNPAEMRPAAAEEFFRKNS